jgi:hypothetical protein
MLSSKLGADGKSEDKHIPNFAPWSQEAFLARLKTFNRVSDWYPKPEVIGEMHWAKRGWSVVDVNTVACKGGCERRVVVKLDRMGTIVKKTLASEASAAVGAANEEEEEEEEEEEVDEAELEKALAERYQDEIVNGHSETCLWRKAACKDDIYRLSLVRPIVWQPQLREAYISLLGVGKSIKDIRIRSLPNTDEEFLPYATLASELPADVISTTDTEPSLKTRALEIALHGWHGSLMHSTDLLQCETCFQRIGLWMYQPGYRPGRTNNNSDEHNEKDWDDELVFIDLVEMHREHCPWRNSVSQKATGSLAGLHASQILHRVVSTWVREQRRKCNEQQDVVDDVQSMGSPEIERPKPSREEVARQDMERESRLRKLKRMFTVKRTSKVEPHKASGSAAGLRE